MKKVITYGTYDLLHVGHIRLLERAKKLGDYLVVGVTADSFDMTRGKINVRQTLNERMESVRQLGIADEIIVEEYEGQKIDDIKRMGIDIFTVGSDWKGRFDYLKEYCDVIYLDRTAGISSSDLRSERAGLRIGFVGSMRTVGKHLRESEFVNGVVASGVLLDEVEDAEMGGATVYRSYSDLLDDSDAVYVASHPREHYEQVKMALEAGKHVLCESPIALNEADCSELYDCALNKGLILADAIKTAYSTAFHRLLLMVKSGRIGRVVSVQATCTSLSEMQSGEIATGHAWPASLAWGPTALLPVLQLLGTAYADVMLLKCPVEGRPSFDCYGRAQLIYSDAVGMATFGKAVKSEGSMVVSGTEGYIYVPSPWWKTDYFEIRKEDPSQNRRFFYQLDGEGIRHEIISFARAIERGDSSCLLVERETSLAIARVMGMFLENSQCVSLKPIRLNMPNAGEGVVR